MTPNPSALAGLSGRPVLIIGGTEGIGSARPGEARSDHDQTVASIQNQAQP